jgi:predicted choloylglycine hydrolase
VGLKQGRFYKKEKLKLQKTINFRLLKKQVKIYKQFYPEHLERLAGIAKGMNQSLDEVYYNFLVLPLPLLKRNIKKENGCTIFGVKTKETTIVGRNYDWVPIDRKIFEINKVNINNKLAHLTISDMGIWRNKNRDLIYDTIDIINESGLYIGLTFAYDNKWNFGIWPTDMISLIGENCRNVQEAIRKFKGIPLACPKNFFMADSSRQFVVVEHTSKRYKVIKPMDEFLIQTNNYINKELAKEDSVLKEKPENDTFIRYYEVLQAINHYKKKLTLNRVKKILDNTKTHIFENQKKMKTIWTLALVMKNKKYRLYYIHRKKLKHKTISI